MKAKVTYRGWPAHYMNSDECIYHLNTLIECGDVHIVVSTVGLEKDNDPKSKAAFKKINIGRYYETTAFFAKMGKHAKVWNADVTRQVHFESRWFYPCINDMYEVDEGHLLVVREIVDRMEAGEFEANGRIA